MADDERAGTGGSTLAMYTRLAPSVLREAIALLCFGQPMGTCDERVGLKQRERARNSNERTGFPAVLGGFAACAPRDLHADPYGSSGRGPTGYVVEAIGANPRAPQPDARRGSSPGQHGSHPAPSLSGRLTPPPQTIFKFWRRGRDSNPRWAFDPRPLSKRVPSTTRSPLRLPRCGERKVAACPSRSSADARSRRRRTDCPVFCGIRRPHAQPGAAGQGAS